MKVRNYIHKSKIWNLRHLPNPFPTSPISNLKFQVSNFLPIILALALTQNTIAQTNYTQYVNPMIGTGGHGHTFPGATVPFGMVQLSADTRIDGSWDGCSGYHYSDKKIYGFSHTHLSGTGCSDYGDILFVPSTKKMVPTPEKYAQAFKHEEEKASAGYYAVKLANKVSVELTASTRVGFHKYTFPGNEGHIILDLAHRDKVLSSYVKVTGKRTIEGSRISEAWAKKQYIYFAAEFSEDMEWEMFLGGKSMKDQRLLDNYYSGKDVKSVFRFKTKTNKTVYLKVGISTVSVEGAKKNLREEIPHWDFNKTKSEAEALWNKELSKIEVTSSDKDKLTVFYTAMYHTMLQPNVNMDVDGTYRTMKGDIAKAEGFTYYSVFSLWDTFRAAHPLYNIIHRERSKDFIKTFLAQYQSGGRLPVWELASNETDCMIGYHSVSVIADAYAKGIRDFDLTLAAEAMQKSANWNHLGLPAYINKGYLEKEDEHESVSKNLEYSYDDWCIAEFLKETKTSAHADRYYQRSSYWKNLFDTQSGFIRPRSNGGWMKPFDPFEVNNNYTEANGWQYTFFVPHDISGMMKAMGGNENFVKKLDELFTTESKTTGREQADITGLIGQYAHGNEPSHHMAYLYTYAGQPWKTQERVHYIMEEFYKNSPDGLIGNEDCGQMSAWYIFSALGFYPVCPGSTQYAIGTPAFEKAVINLENGKKFTIHAVNLDKNNFYLHNTTHYALTHNQIMGGGSLSFHMRNTPDTEILKNPEVHFPQSGNPETKFISAPVIVTNQKTFRDSMLIEIFHPDPEIELVYYLGLPCGLLDGCVLTVLPYKKPFYIKESEWITVYPDVNPARNTTYAPAKGYFHKIPHHYTVEIKGNYNPQYTAGGDGGIIDGLHGDENWRKGGWQGYQNQDFEAIIDLQKSTQIQSVDVSFLQDTRAWIFFPSQLEIWSSSDGKEWSEFGVRPSQTIAAPAENVPVSIQTLNSFTKPITTRYIKVKAKNFGKLPKWHEGYPYNGNAFIFIDEITIH